MREREKSLPAARREPGEGAKGRSRRPQTGREPAAAIARFAWSRYSLARPERSDAQASSPPPDGMKDPATNRIHTVAAAANK